MNYTEPVNTSIIEGCVCLGGNPLKAFQLFLDVQANLKRTQHAFVDVRFFCVRELIELFLIT